MGVPGVPISVAFPFAISIPIPISLSRPIAFPPIHRTVPASIPIPIPIPPLLHDPNLVLINPLNVPPSFHFDRINKFFPFNLTFKDRRFSALVLTRGHHDQSSGFERPRLQRAYGIVDPDFAVMSFPTITHVHGIVFFFLGSFFAWFGRAVVS